MVAEGIIAEAVRYPITAAPTLPGTLAGQRRKVPAAIPGAEEIPTTATTPAEPRNPAAAVQAATIRAEPEATAEVQVTEAVPVLREAHIPAAAAVPPEAVHRCAAEAADTVGEDRQVR